MSQSVQMPVLYHGQRQSHLPGDLLTAKHVFVLIDAVRPPLSRHYEGPYAVLSRSFDAKTFTVDRCGPSWVVSVDRLKPAFSLSGGTNSPSSPAAARELDPLPLEDDSGRPHLTAALPPVAVPPQALVEDPVVLPPVGAPDPAVDLGPAPAPAPVPGPAPAVFTHSGPVSRPPDRYQACLETNKTISQVNI